MAPALVTVTTPGLLLLGAISRRRLVTHLLGRFGAASVPLNLFLDNFEQLCVRVGVIVIGIDELLEGLVSVFHKSGVLAHLLVEFVFKFVWRLFE